MSLLLTWGTEGRCFWQKISVFPIFINYKEYDNINYGDNTDWIIADDK